MNPKRIVLAIAIVFVVAFATDLLIHQVWLGEAYRQTPYQLWRPEPEMIDRSGWLLWSPLLAVTMLVFLWAGFVGSGSIRRGALFGLGLGLFRYADVLAQYVLQPLPGDLMAKFFLAHIAQSVLLGILTSAVYKPPPPEMSPERRRTIGRRWLIAVGVVALLSAVKAFYFSGTPQRPIAATAAWMKAISPTWVTTSPGLPHSIQSVSDVQQDGEDSLRFELRKGEKLIDAWTRVSYRAEVDPKDFPPIKSVRWYTFNLLLPEDFPREPNRLVFAQWHGADKRHLGEISRNPPLAFRYVDGRFYITLRTSPDRVIKDMAAVPEKVLFETTSFPHHQWNDFIVQAKWSWEEDGFVNVWWNRKPIVQYRGPVGYNDNVGPYFKFGLYRDDTDKTYVAYFNHVRIGANPEEVGLQPKLSFPEPAEASK